MASPVAMKRMDKNSTKPRDNAKSEMKFTTMQALIQVSNRHSTSKHKHSPPDYMYLFQAATAECIAFASQLTPKRCKVEKNKTETIVSVLGAGTIGAGAAATTAATTITTTVAAIATVIGAIKLPQDSAAEAVGRGKDAVAVEGAAGCHRLLRKKAKAAIIV